MCVSAALKNGSIRKKKEKVELRCRQIRKSWKIHKGSYFGKGKHWQLPTRVGLSLQVEMNHDLLRGHEESYPNGKAEGYVADTAFRPN